MDTKVKWKKIRLSYDQMTFLHNIKENELWIKTLHERDIYHLEKFLCQGWYNNKRDTVILSTLRRLYLNRIQVNKRYKVKKEWQN